MSIEHENSKDSLNMAWEESQRNIVITELKNGKSLQEIIYTLKNFREAFAKMLDTIVCSDERVPAGEGSKIGFAGQLILAKEEEVNKFIEEHLWEIKTVTSHDNCGAAQVKYKDLIKENELIPEISTPDELGMAHSRKLVNLINELRKKADPERAKKEVASYRHISQNEMTGELHNARGICFDGTGRFDPSVMPDMPETYVCSAPGFGLSKEYCQAELKILSGIALGDHGFGNKFTEENPFYIFVSASDPIRLEELKTWAREAVSEVEGVNGRIEVVGFVYPAQEENLDKK